jgi:hypothetical protein
MLGSGCARDRKEFFHILGHYAMSIQVPTVHPQGEFRGETVVTLEMDLGGCILPIEKYWD